MTAEKIKTYTAGVFFVAGICIAASEGDYFPWLNGIGLALLGMSGYLASKLR